jgi:gliding motility-associated-like protein
MNFSIKNMHKTKILILFFVISISLFSTNNLYGQQFLQIESILVDACDEGTGDEGLNEMVRFRVETVAINVADIRVDGISGTGTPTVSNWTTANPFLGWITPGTAAWDTAQSKVNRINNSIVNCGKLILATGGTSGKGLIPAGKKGLIITSYNFLPFANDFSTLSDTLYVVFQNNPSTTGGNFTNFGATGIRKLRLHQISTGTNEDVQYDKALLINQLGAHVAQDGAGVRYTDAGVATYYNDGCQAPYVPLSAAWTAPAAMCPNSATVNLSTLVTGTTGGTWSGTGVSGATFNPTGLSGNINVTYKVGNTPCVDSVTHVIQVIASASAAWTAPASILCQSSPILSLTPLVTGTAGGTWSGNGVTGTNFNPAGLNGNINITYKVGTAPCIDSVTHIIQVITSPNAAWTAPSTSLCQSSTAINLTTLVTGTAGGTWSGNGVTGTSFSPVGLLGNISVTYKVGTAPCVDSVTHTIQVVANPNANWTAPAPMCQASNGINLNTLLSGSAATGGTWSGSGVTGTMFSPVGLNGSINITYTVGTAPCISSESHSITISPSLIPTWVAPAPMCQSAASFDLNTLLAATASTGGTWSGTGVTGNIFSPSGLLIGNINVTYTVGVGPCAVSETHAIEIVANAIASWTPPASGLCQSSAALNLNIFLNGNATFGGTWSGTGVSGNTLNSSGLSGNINLTYTVGTPPCTATESHDILILPNYNASWAPPTSVCADAAPIDLTQYITGDQGGTWIGQGVVHPQFNPAGLTGNVSISYIVSGATGCTDTVTHTIAITPIPTPTWFTPTVICKNLNTFNLNSLITGDSGGQWSGNGVNSNILNLSTVGDSLQVTYTVNTNGCIASRTGVLYFSYVNADFTITPSEGTAPLSTTITNLSQNATSYDWNFGNGFTSIETNPSVSYPYEGTYMVWLIATSSLGCTDSVHKIVIVNESGDFIPNAITPNGDYVNDEFYPIISKILDSYRMLIYNRWGNLIYETKTQSDKWDGTYQNEPVPEGVYFYTISYFHKGKYKNYNGSLTVIY